jgi:hypothetical protein
MSFLSTGGAKWSQITIDADKDMGGKGLSNLKQVAAAMIGGDLIAKGLGGILVRIPAGIVNTVLTSAGPGALPTWAPGGLYLNRYYPAALMSTVAANVVAASQFIAKNAALATALKYAYADDPSDNIKLFLSALASTKTVTEIASADQSKSLAAALHRFFDIQLVVAAAEAYNATGSVYTDETAAAQNPTTNDMHLLPAAPSVNCAYYFGWSYLWDYLLMQYDTAGAGTWTLVWEYWNGAWVSLAGVTDGTSGFKGTTGLNTVTFTRPGDWATTTVNSIGPYYYIRARLSAYTSITTQPLGTQAWCVQTTYN